MSGYFWKCLAGQMGKIPPIPGTNQIAGFVDSTHSRTEKNITFFICLIEST